MSKGMPEGVRTAIYWSLGLGVVALILIILLVIFGNLSGNVGFAAGTQGYNDTQNVILNYSQAATNTSSQLPTVGTIIGIALLLVILIGLLVFAISRMVKVAGSTGGSNSNFG